MHEHSSVQPLINGACEQLFVDFLYQKLGLVIKKHQLKTLHDAIDKGCALFACLTWQDYYQRLKKADKIAPEMEHLTAAVTIGESYFFRDHNQIAYLRDEWLPEIIAKRRRQGNKSLRIWSSGCSNGQELFTIAMLLADAIDDLPQWNIQLLGTDINVNVLSTALRGHYTSWSFRATDNTVRDQYFKRQLDGYTIDEKLRGMTSFTYLNLADDEYPSILTKTHSMDLILCRNVFIYFDKAVVDRVMSKFSQCLLPGGVLMLGASDLIATNTDSLRLIQHGDIFYYQHSGSAQLHQLDMNSAPETRSQASVVPAKDRVLDKRIVVAAPMPPASVELIAMKKLYGLLHDSKWFEALPLIDDLIQQQGRTAELLQHQAKVLANIGELEQAQEICAESLVVDSLDKHSYFLNAMILLEMGDEQGAELNFRKTIYLDTQFVEAHFQLGLLLMNGGKEKVGKKCLDNALNLAKAAKPDSELHQASGMTFGRFGSILEHEVAVYSDQLGEL
ncbi:MAG: protein-glutamate O-methyltransferase CheR [Mariprofundus sp.]|nr:protein-glutamate O-methyltransferase CheR [Mariprofundus sp.]